MRERSTNRHGIPRYPHRGPVRRTCIWPSCREDVDPIWDLHMCHAHVRYVVDSAARHFYPGKFAEPKAQPVPKAAPVKVGPTEGVVYFLRSGGHIKIGWTSDLAKRMRTYPPDSTLLAHHPGTRKDEQRLHRRFAVHRTHGREWYALVPAILEHIKRVVAEHGQPETVDFGAKPVEVPRPHQMRQGPKPRSWISGAGELRAG